MKIASIACKNFKVHSDLDMNFDGKSVILLGDTGKGKSTILELLQTCLMERELTDNPLKNGTESGYIKTIIDDSGYKYTISRTFARGKKPGRFKVTSQDGRTETLTDFLERVFGIAFKNKKFDYNKYFFQEKTPAARLKYFIDATGGDQIIKNISDIKKKKADRENIGGQRNIQKSLLDAVGFIDISQEKLQKDYEHYLKKRERSEAVEVKEEYLKKNTIVTDDLIDERDAIESQVEIYLTLTENKAKNLRLIEELKAQIDVLMEDNIILDTQLADRELTNLNVEQTNLAAAEVQKKIDTAEEENAKVIKNSEDLYEAELDKIEAFNIERSQFAQNIKTFKEYNRLDAEWNTISEQMNELIEQNEKLTKKTLPIPELSIKEIDGNDVLYYKDVEFSFDALSKGETIKATAAIQKALNPKGMNFILIPEAQSLGSSVDEILMEAKKFDIQVILEVTQRDEELQLVFIDETKPAEEQPKKPAVKRGPRKPTVKKDK